jgi:hypothetical protein
VVILASGKTPSTGTASGIPVPSACAPVNTSHTSVPGVTTTTWGRMHQRRLLTFYHSGFRQRSLCAPVPQSRPEGGERTPR